MSVDLERLEAFERDCSRFHRAELVQVLKVVTGEGIGTRGSIFREVTRYVDLDTGVVLAVIDPFPDGRTDMPDFSRPAEPDATLAKGLCAVCAGAGEVEETECSACSGKGTA
jgi:hypothetical protein